MAEEGVLPDPDQVGTRTVTLYGVRAKIMAASSPIRGKRVVSRGRELDQARAEAQMWSEHPEDFAEVEVVQADIMIGQWAPVPEG